VRIYVAGPLGFAEAGRVFHDTIVGSLERLGHEVIDPWQLTPKKKTDAAAELPYGVKRRRAWRKLNREIADNNRRGIDRCDAIVAVLDGADVDSGTAAEIGYGYARGKKILGYRGDFRLAGDNDGAVVNLQVEYFIRESGGDIVTEIAALPAALKALASQPPRSRGGDVYSTG
jgi:nucleoside 2-deoxyribosyltransferase